MCGFKLTEAVVADPRPQTKNVDIRNKINQENTAD
jgi:hypothetical protein